MTDNSDALLKEAKTLADEFEALEGRRPRMYLSGITPEDALHTKKILATVFSDMGWDVDVGPDGDTPEGAAQDASDNDVHMVGFFSPGSEYKTLFPKLILALEARGREDIMAFVFGNVPKKDYPWLFKEKACAIFGAGADMQEGCIVLLRIMAKLAREETREE